MKGVLLEQAAFPSRCATVQPGRTRPKHPAMTVAPIPPDEARRLAALQALQVLDRPPEAALDRITALLASALNVPVALVTLLDSKRAWFASRVGLQASEAPRDAAFCAHAVADRAMLVVSDMLGDARFADNPLVAGAPGVRAYAGVPLMLDDGSAIGTLCAIDYAPRAFDPAQLSMLSYLGDLTVQQLRLLQVRAQVGARAND